MTKFRSPYRFPDPTEMGNSTPPTWIQWMSREANDLFNELTQAMDQEMNKTLIKFRPIPEDKEPEQVDQLNLIGFETPQAGNEVGIQGKRAIALSGNHTRTTPVPDRRSQCYTD